jgi:hypothetical protein
MAFNFEVFFFFTEEIVSNVKFVCHEKFLCYSKSEKIEIFQR